MVFQTGYTNQGGILGQISEPTRNETLTVGATSVEVCEKRTKQNKRKVLVIRNTSDADTKIITINQGANPAVANEGIVLRRNESYADSSETGYECWQDQITAICEVAGGQLSIFER